VTLPGATPPGWYPDPWTPGQLRWWDGRTWTPAWWSPQLPAEEMAARRRVIQPKLRYALVFLIGGALVVAYAIGAAGTRIVDQATSGVTFTAPGPASMHLDRGDYVVFEQTRRSTSTITVTDASGTHVPVLASDDNEFRTRGGVGYSSSATFTVPSDGEYVVEVRGGSASAGRVLVARSISDSFRSVGAFVGIGLVGGAVFIVGVVLLIIGTVRRDKVRYERVPM
jgi:hypothetical protein